MKKFLFTLFTLQFFTLPSLPIYAAGNLPGSDKKANLLSTPDSGTNSPPTISTLIAPGVGQEGAPGATLDKKPSLSAQANDKGYLPQDEAVSAKDANLAKKETHYQGIIKQYSLYIASVPEDVRNEIREFRKETAKIQKMKRDLYKKLSIGAQSYLKHEKAFRAKLPIDPSDPSILKATKDLVPSSTN